MANPTLITGCALSIPAEGKAVWGDLWFIGQSFVFVANCKGFDTDWLYGDEALSLLNAKAIHLVYNAPYLDRRGVVVFDRKYGAFNGDALAHMAKWNPDFPI